MIYVFSSTLLEIWLKAVYWSVMISILWALQDSAIFISISMTNKEKSSNVEPDESKGAWHLIITDKLITIASIID